jgi:hypothetical protein
VLLSCVLNFNWKAESQKALRRVEVDHARDAARLALMAEGGEEAEGLIVVETPPPHFGMDTRHGTYEPSLVLPHAV